VKYFGQKNNFFSAHAHVHVQKKASHEEWASSSPDSISPEDNALLTPRHEYDTPNIHDNLWVNHGIGTFTVKEIGCTRNTVTKICCDVVRK
jgi:hypothetical protein